MSDQALITEGEIAYVRSLHPTLNIRQLTNQQARFALLITNGFAKTKAAAQCGLDNTKMNELIEQPEFQVVLNHLINRKEEAVEITRDMLNMMLLESHAKAATATEEIMATRELGKMNDLYADNKKTAAQDITVNVVNVKQIQRLSDDDLMRIAGNSIIDMEPIDDESVNTGL